MRNEPTKPFRPIGRPSYDDPYQASAETTSYESSYVSGMGFLTYREYDEIFEGLAVVYTYRQRGADLTGGDEAQRIVVMPTSAGFFEVLGVPPRQRAHL